MSTDTNPAPKVSAPESFNARLEAKNAALVAAWAATGSKLTPAEKAAFLRRSRDKRLALGHDLLAA